MAKETDFSGLNSHIKKMWEEHLIRISSEIESMELNDKGYTFFDGTYRSKRDMYAAKSNVEGVLLVIDGKDPIFEEW